MRVCCTRRWPLLTSCILIVWVAWHTPVALAQKAGFVAPPRTIADITAILDQEKPDPAKRAKAEADADAEPPAGADRATVRDFYLRRAQARRSIGRLADAIEDCKRAAANSSDYQNDGSSIELFQEYLMRLNGDHTEAIALLEGMARRLNVPNTNKGRAFDINTRIAFNLQLLGDVNKAEVYVNRNIALLEQARTWPNAQPFLSFWEARVESGKGNLFSARGRIREAEVAYRNAEALDRDALVKMRSWPYFRSQPGQMERVQFRKEAHQNRIGLPSTSRELLACNLPRVLA